MQEGERQVAPTLAGIRHDHVARYDWASKQLPAGMRVMDLACGIGYGSRILAEDGKRVLAIDRDAEAISYARNHYAHEGVTFQVGDANGLHVSDEPLDAAVCFETIEHIEDPRPLLWKLRAIAPLLIASVPNEDVFPYEGQKYHFRHYTPQQFEALLISAGWKVESWWGQLGVDSEVEAKRSGRTLIAIARPGDIPEPYEPRPAPTPESIPERIAILGLGPSVEQYLGLVKRHGGRRVDFDETWAINALGDVFVADRIFHMDDVRIQEIRAAARPLSNIAAMLEWLKKHPGPVYTSRAHPGYPGLVEFPIEAVVHSTRFAYFNSTAAYAVAYACYLHDLGVAAGGQGVKKLGVFGNDFTYPNAHDAEKGRACVEFWLGLAAQRGIKLVIPRTSSLMDACHAQADRLYGYDTLAVTLKDTGTRIQFTFEPRAERPTAEDIERRYDHSAPVSEQVSSKG